MYREATDFVANDKILLSREKFKFWKTSAIMSFSGLQYLLNFFYNIGGDIINMLFKIYYNETCQHLDLQHFYDQGIDCLL